MNTFKQTLRNWLGVTQCMDSMSETLENHEQHLVAHEKLLDQIIVFLGPAIDSRNSELIGKCVTEAAGRRAGDAEKPSPR